MSAVFSHGIRYQLTDKNPIKSVRQRAGRAKVPVLWKLRRFTACFDVLALRYRSMVMTDVLTGIRRGELMGLWKDLDFIGGRISVVRSVVDLADLIMQTGKLGHAWLLWIVAGLKPLISVSC
jgi:integrase